MALSSSDGIIPGPGDPARGLANHQAGRCTDCILGIPEIDLVLDALGAGAVLEFLQGEEHGEGLAVDVGGIEDDEGEAEAVPELGGEVVLALGRPEEEAG